MTRAASSALSAIGLVVALALLLFSISAAVSFLGVLSAAGAYLLPTVGPWTIVVGVAVTAGAVIGRRRRPWSATATAAAGAVSVLMTVVMVVGFVDAVDAAGGSVDVLRGLALGSPGAAQPDLREPYGLPGRTLVAAVYRPRRPTATAPVLIYVHGGGWIIGTADDRASDLRWLADQGWLVVSLDYRLASATDHTWQQAPEDVACGAAWVAANAHRLGGDPTELGILGDSAGGNLAVDLAYRAAAGDRASPCGSPVPVAKAVVVQYPVVDPRSAWAHNARVPGFSPRDFLHDYVGGSPEEFPARFDAITSATYLSEFAPPTLVISPNRDDLIPPDGVRHFAAAARASGVDVTLAELPFAGHNYDALAADSLGDQAGRSLTLHYLVDHLRSPAP